MKAHVNVITGVLMLLSQKTELRGRQGTGTEAESPGIGNRA